MITVYFMFQWCDYNENLSMTAQLSWHVQNFIVTEFPEFKLSLTNIYDAVSLQ